MAIDKSQERAAAHWKLDCNVHFFIALKVEFWLQRYNRIYWKQPSKSKKNSSGSVSRL